MDMGDGVDAHISSVGATNHAANIADSGAGTAVEEEESAIRTLEDVEEILALVDEFNISDLRIAEGGVVVEVSRPGGRGFEDGRLMKRELGGAVVTEHVVQHSDGGGGGGGDVWRGMDGGEAVDDVVETRGKELEEEEEKMEKERVEKERRKNDLDTVYDSDFIVTSNRVGFFFSGAKNKPPLVMVGDHVDFNQPVCIIEQLGQQYVYLSEASGTVIKIFVEDGDAVEYGQHVMVIRPD